MMMIIKNLGVDLILTGLKKVYFRECRRTAE